MIKKFIMILSWGVIWYTSLFAQEKLTLTDCLQQALKKSRMLQVADLSLTIAEKKLAESKSQRLPTLALNSLYTRIGKITSFSIPAGPGGEKKTFKFGTPNRMNFDIKMQVPLFTWGRISSTINISRIGKALSTVQRKQQITTITDQVLRAYYAVLLNKEVIRLHRVNVKRAQNHFQVAKKRYNSGFVPKLELLRAQVQLKNAQSSLEEAQGNMEKSKIFLAKIIGREDENFSLDGSFNFKPLDTNSEELITAALKIRSDLTTVQLQQRINRNQIKLAQSGNKLNIFLFSSYNVQNGFDPMDPERFVDNWNVGVQLSLPLFDGFATSNRVQQARLQLQSLELQEAEIQELIRMQIRQALISIKQAEEKIATQRENIALAREALQAAETQYKNGLVSSLEVLDAQQRLSQSELLHTQAIFNHHIAKLDLCRAMEDYSLFEFSLNK